MAQEAKHGLADEGMLGMKAQTAQAAPTEGKDAGVRPPRGSGDERKTPPKPLAPSSGPTPSDRLNAMGVYLPAQALEHVFHAHGPWKNMEKSQFAECHDSPEAIEQLIATGMETAGAIGCVVDGYGRQYTLCRSAETLWYRERGFHRGGRSYPDRFHATHLFVVVTLECHNGPEDDPDHVVLTAFPVSRNW
jgi:hypothetical protein